jgi:hypothetical protein
MKSVRIRKRHRPIVKKPKGFYEYYGRFNPDLGKEHIILALIKGTPDKEHTYLYAVYVPDNAPCTIREARNWRECATGCKWHEVQNFYLSKEQARDILRRRKSGLNPEATDST